MSVFSARRVAASSIVFTLSVVPAIARGQASSSSPPPPAETPSASAAPPSASSAPALSAEERLRIVEERLRALEAHTPEPAIQPTTPPATSAAPAPATPPAPDLDFQPEVTPFAFADFSWAPASYAPSDSPLHYGPFTGELRLDVPYHYEFVNPVDNTVSGSSEVFRANEFQITQIGFGGDFYYKGVQIRLMTQFGMYSQTTPRNDPSTARGQWNLADAYRYISEAYVGYHFNVMAGLNIQAGIFMSYIGLWSYYNFDNWTYQPSYVSSNTPWFFNGLRIQWFPTERFKIEPWLVNGWQSYGEFNESPGVGLQTRWNPVEWFSILGNQYYGTDTLGTPGRMRVHTDDSVMARFYNNPRNGSLSDPRSWFSRLAGSLTFDAGCEFGPGSQTAGTSTVNCTDQYFLGFMAYMRAWFYRNMIGLTVGGGAITNPGRYLVLMPPINGATAFSGTPYFTANKGDPFTAWDVQTTLDIMPTRNITLRIEYTHRGSDVPYFAGHGGVTPLVNGIYTNTGAPGSFVPGWAPDLVNFEDRFTFALMARL